MTQKNALLSVYDKTGIEDFAGKLIELGWNLVSSGGTAKAIAAAGHPVTDVSELTGYPIMLGHRVVTLHPKVHGGILADLDEPEHQADLKQHNITPFGLVVVNVYPFTSNPSIDLIDIGGPAMVRAAAKNHAHVGIVIDPGDYDEVLEELKATGALSAGLRKRLAVKAFALTKNYDTAVAAWMSDGHHDGLHGELVEELKYGENPYMSPARLYKTNDIDPLAIHRFTLVEGDARSMVGLTDVDSLLQVLTHITAGYELNFDLNPYMAVGVKHGNACGAAIGNDPVEVTRRMVAGDKRAIFGGVVMTNYAITREVAEALMARDEGDPPRMFDGVFGSSFASDAPEVLKRYKDKCRMMANPALADMDIDSLDTSPRYRQIRGDYIKQPNYTYVLDITKSQIHGQDPTLEQWQDVVFAWAIGCVSNSNTITLVKNGQLIGNGVGQQDRVGAAELAIKRARDAGHDTNGAIAWSDSFFPATDGPEVLARAGIKVIFASSGSKLDPSVIEKCQELGITLVMQPDAKVRGFAKH